MKFVLSTFSCGAYTLTALLLLSFSAPIVSPVFASDSSNACESMKPANLNTVEDLLSMGYYQQECQKDRLAAISYFTKAINLNPKAEEPYSSRANAYQQLGNYKAAVADYTVLINLNTDRFDLIRDAYWHRARIYNKLSEKQKSISDLTQLITNYNGNVGDYLLRAKLYKDLGNNEGAVASYHAADKILQQELNSIFGNNHIGLGVSLPAPQPATRLTLQSIVKAEVERALNLSKYTTQHPIIQQLGTQIQDLHEQLANIQSQPYTETLKALISNAASTKIDGIEKERTQLMKQFTPDSPTIRLIDTQIQELKILIDRNKDVSSFKMLRTSA
jgi:tetratricopeptide (TPR) repeat protein